MTVHTVDPARYGAEQPTRRPLVALLAANAISLYGNVMASIAIPWFVLVTTGSALQTGIAALFTSAPMAVGAFFGGTLVDRLGARRASLIGDLASAVGVAGIPALHALGLLEYWHILAFGFVGSLFDAPSSSAREALLPGMSRRAGTPLSRSLSFWTASEHTAYVAGAPLAGLLIVLLGAPALLWIDVASFVVSALLVAVAVPGAEAARTDDPRGARSYIGELLDGLRFIVRERVVATIVVASTLGALLIDALAPVVLPVYVRTQFGDPSALGLAIAAYGVGGLVGIAVFGVAERRLGRRAFYVGAWLAYAAASYALVPVPALVPLLAALAVIGITTGALDPMDRLLRQERTPPALLGRVSAAALAAPRLATPIAVFVAGLMLETVGLRATLLVFAVGNTLLAIAVAVVPSLRGVGRPSGHA
ncbi:MAG TPA: MFS transporter [Candidatus Limnocylindria bacterium]|nr:MFS transporter [Candidatus Limnocylindria bacterium]